MIRILVVHATRLISSLLRAVLSEEPDINVVGVAHSVAGALRELKACGCNIVLVSADLPASGALELTGRVAAEAPDVKVLVFGVPESKNIILQYVMAGASGYVLQEVSIDKMFDNIRAAYDDQALISPQMAAAFMEHIAELAQVASRVSLDVTAYESLTPRELEVLELIDAGLTNLQIAERLFIEVGTVKNHVHNILSKLEVSSRSDAAAHLPYIQDQDATSA